MKILEREKPLAAWLEANCPDALEDYEKYLGEDLSEVYFLDLQAWLRWKHREIWNEYVEALRRAVADAKALFANTKKALPASKRFAKIGNEF